jgi:hypothetical protein
MLTLRVVVGAAWAAGFTLARFGFPIKEIFPRGRRLHGFRRFTFA